MVDISKDPFEVGSDQFGMIDADTIKYKDSGERGRLRGVNAPETPHTLEDGTTKYGTAGGVASHEIISDLIGGLGYTNVKELDQEAAFGRKTVELQSGLGRDLTTDLISHGTLGLTTQSTRGDYEAQQVGRALGSQIFEGSDRFNDARDQLKSAMIAEGYDPTNVKGLALNELEYKLGGGPERYSGVQFRSPDRDLMNNANNPLSAAWDQAMDVSQETLYGIASMIGNTTGWEGLEEFGEAGVYRQRSDMGETANFIADYKDVNGFGDAMEFLGTNITMSLPFMATTMIGMAAAPATMGASMLAPVSMYAGMNWNEQEGDNKNAAAAVAGGVVMAALDALGVKGSMAALKGTSKEVFKQGVKTLMDTKGLTKEAAEAVLAKQTKRQMAKIAVDGGKLLGDQVTKKQLVIDTLKRTGSGFGAEGVTEALQEAVGYTASHTQEGWDWNDLSDRMVSAAVAGGALGGAFGTVGGIKNAAGWVDAKWAMGEATADDMLEADKWAADEKSRRGYVPSVNEASDEIYMSRVASGKPIGGGSVAERAAASRQHRKDTKGMDKVFEYAKRIPRAFRMQARSAIPLGLQRRSRTARILADMIGANHDRVYGGSHFEDFKFNLRSKYKSMVTPHETVYTLFNDGKMPGRSGRAEIGDRIYSLLNKAVDAKGKFNPNLLPADLSAAQRTAIVKLAAELNTMSNTLHKDQSIYNPELGYIDNYLFKYKTLDREAVRENRAEFEQLLQEQYNVGASEASKLVDAILNLEQVRDIGDAFDMAALQDEGFNILKGQAAPSAHKKRTLGLSENKKFNKFMERDIYANIAAAAESAARFQAYREFLGEDNKKLAAMLNQMEEDGLTHDEVNQIAEDLENYLNAESGNYKRATTEEGKWVQENQRTLMFVMTLAGLPLAVVSSLPELAMATRSLTFDQIFGNTNTSIQGYSKEFLPHLKSYFKRLKSIVTKENARPEDQLTDNMKALRDQGYYEWDVGAATKSGLHEQTRNAFLRDIMDVFFEANALKDYTDYTRAVRISLAGDFFFDHLLTVMENEGKPKTREVLEAEQQLRNVGLENKKWKEIYQMLQDHRAGTLSPEGILKLKEELRGATTAFVNDGILLPQAYNRPLLYQDPRFALFTQFQGFIATFTAQILPKMWGEYVKKGSPAMKYSTFATMATMVLLGFVSQDLKDQLKYQEKSPYLDDAEYVRRGVFASGLFGTYERGVNTLFPQFEDRSDNSFDWAIGEIIDQSPALGWMANVGTAGKNLLEGELGKATRGALGATPIIAPFTSIRQAAGKAVDDATRDEFEW